MSVLNDVDAIIGRYTTGWPLLTTDGLSTKIGKELFLLVDRLYKKGYVLEQQYKKELIATDELRDENQRLTNLLEYED